MATFVIVHGGFSGGWEWTPVARHLRALGHEVHTPTLTGMGAHGHLAAAMSVGLSTHVEDIVGLLEFEDLHDVVLVGSGLGGMAVTSAADRVAHRVALVVYLDALVPYDGECALDLLPRLFADFVCAGIEQHGESWQVPTLVDPMPQAAFSSREGREAYQARLRDQPAMSFVEPVYLTGAIDHVPRAFLRCTMTELADSADIDPVAEMVRRASDGYWHYREVLAPHDPHLTHPGVTVWVLTELLTSVLEKQTEGTVSIPRQVPRHLATDSDREQMDWFWSPN